MDAESPRTYCGYVALVGAPNAGKSSLLNAFLGQRLSIVTPKPQTTWQRIVGLRSTDSHQLVFLDTPGTLAPRILLDRSLVFATEAAADEADVLVIVVDAASPLRSEDKEALSTLATGARVPRIGLANKIDAASPERIREAMDWLSSVSDQVIPVSATAGTGLAEAIEAIEARLPEGPFLYPEDDLAAAPARFFVAELVREAIFEQYHAEVPYASICRVEEFREDEPKTYIQVTIYVEKSSQKGIIIGDKGAAIRSLGTAARSRIETFLGTPVYLDLWVKVLQNWRRRPDRLRSLGLPVPPDDIAT